MTLAETIKPNIQAMLCSVHGIHPIVDTIGNEFEINCCCNKFHQECTQEVKALLAEMDFTLNNLTIV